MTVSSATAERICERINQGDWFFLNFIGANMDPFVFSMILEQLDKLLAAKLNRMGNGSASIQKNA